ncbi:MAG: endopygalactorunase [Pseudobacter sp.]|uniref:endopygalactorunase n=1 Tax=Pseudobacter sp. TaxID=2045420 RepID=UPI003F7DBE1E
MVFLFNNSRILLLFTMVMPLTLMAQDKATTAYHTRPQIFYNPYGGRDSANFVLISSTTYAFTPDTHPDSGLVHIRPTVKSMPGNWNHTIPSYITDSSGKLKTEGEIVPGDFIVLKKQDIKIRLEPRLHALNGRLQIIQPDKTAGTNTDITLLYTAGQRSPDATVRIMIPAGISVDTSSITVNVIGRGAVLLKDLSKQSIGRTGNKYSHRKVGTAKLKKDKNGNTWIILSGLDLRPSNGADITLTMKTRLQHSPGQFIFKSNYSVTEPVALNSFGGQEEEASLYTHKNIADFQRIPDFATTYSGDANTWSRVDFRWSVKPGMLAPQVQFSTDKGKTWKQATASMDANKGSAQITHLKPDKHYSFRLAYSYGKVRSNSNTVDYYSGKIAVSGIGIDGDPAKDYTNLINSAIDSIHRKGGGTLYFDKGWFNVRTIHLKSNVHLFIGKQATIAALKGGDAPETTWFSDKKYRSGLSSTDSGPYDDPDNYMTKQDVGHHYFRNCMFFAEREDNIKITGNGRITGNGNLVTGDKVMNNAPDNRSDKMFTFKLCTNIEIGGLNRNEDLWYDEIRDEPYYILSANKQDTVLANMLHIDQGGHFVLLATGTDNIDVHDTYFGKANGKNARDIYDFMACNNVRVKNIYSKVSSDDIVKPGSDCSLGFTRPARTYSVRNVIGDTNCNLFQIGSETADDIQDICVDNIYVLGANKAGFSISTNDGGHIKNIHLNCGHTGSLHSRSKMLRTFTPFFISISNRARILGAEAGRYSFTENGEKHNELLIKNVNIGKVENILINGIDISEVYAGSSYSGNRWKEYDGKQRRATAIIAGYALPASSVVEGGLDFTLPDGSYTGYIKNVQFNDVHILVKGSNPISDTSANPPELGVGQYNASNLNTQPAYGLWARHAKDLQVKNSSFNFEETDQRYAVFLDDVLNADIINNEMVLGKENATAIAQRGSTGIKTGNNKVYGEEWKKKVLPLSGNRPKQPAALKPPPETGQKQQ